MTRLRQIAMASLAALAIGGVASSASATEIRKFREPVERRHHRSAARRCATARPVYGPGNGLPWDAVRSATRATPQETTARRFCPRSPKRYRCFGCRAGIGGAPPIRPRSCRRSTSSGRARVPSGGCGGGAPITVGGFVYTNTFVQPIALSWKLGGGWFVSTNFGFMVPDGTRQTGTPNPDYWTFEPSVAFSYLGSNWVATLNMFYDINTKSQGVCCSSNSTHHQREPVLRRLRCPLQVRKVVYWPGWVCRSADNC